MVTALKDFELSQIFESKGNLGMFCNEKKLVTIPQEFHFATNERFPPPAAMCDMFDKVPMRAYSCY